MVKIKVDGVQIDARPGQMVIEAAREAGIHIPYLCWHPILKPFGACRMCVVEVTNARGFPTSCTTPVGEGMEVKTNTGPLEEVRRDILALTLSEHPHGCLTCWRIEHCGPNDICLRNVKVTDRCVVCPQNERCELQDTTYALKLAEVPLPYKYRGVKLRTENPFIDHDMNLCIVCGKCVRACNEIEGAYAITFEERGGHTLINTSLGGTLAESGCTFCGHCVDVCPVGAITEKDSKWAGAAEENITSTCSHCSVGCSLTLNVRKQKLIRATFDIEGPANHGYECVRGKFGHKWVYSKDRVLRPRVRDGEGWRETSWDEALALIAAKLGECTPDEVFLLASPKNTNEDNFVLQKFARSVLGTNNVDFSDPAMPQKATDGMARAFGSGAATNTVWGLRDSRFILAVDTDLIFEQPVAGLQVKEAVRRGAHLVVLDPRDTELALLASEKLVCRPGTEAAVLGGLLRLILQGAPPDADFVKNRTQGLDDLKASVEAFTPEAVERVSGITVKQLEQVGRLLATRKPAAFLFGGGLYQADDQVGTALADLAMLTGNIGKPGAGVYPLRGENNSQGAEDMGCRPGLLPGGVPLSSARVRAALAETWGRPMPQAEGMDFDRFLEAARAGKVKAVIAIGENQVLADRAGALADALTHVPFIAVHEVLPGELGKHAQVLLPATTFAERDGTYTNLERRVQRVRKAIAAQGESRPAWEFISALAKRMGAPGFAYAGSSEIMGEIARCAPSYAGVTYARLEMSSLQWPVEGPDHAGTPALHAGRFLRGLGLFQPLTWRDVPLAPAGGPKEGALVALAGVAREIKGTVELAFGNLVEISSADAAPLGISDGDRVTLSSAMGTLTAKAHVNGRAPQGTVLLTMPQFNVVTDLFNKVTPGPLAAFAQAKSYPVRLAKAAETTHPMPTATPQGGALR